MDDSTFLVGTRVSLSVFEVDWAAFLLVDLVVEDGVSEVTSSEDTASEDTASEVALDALAGC